MIAVICLFFPSVLGLWAYEKLSKRALTGMERLFRFCATVLAVNLVCFAVKRFFLSTAYDSLLSGGDMLPGVALNYLVLAIPATVVIVVVELLFSRKVKIVLEENSDEERS